MVRELDPAKRRRHAFELDRGKTGFGSLTQRSSAAAHCVLPAAGGNGDREILLHGAKRGISRRALPDGRRWIFPKADSEADLGSG